MAASRVETLGRSLIPVTDLRVEIWPSAKLTGITAEFSSTVRFARFLLLFEDGYEAVFHLAIPPGEF